METIGNKPLDLGRWVRRRVCTQGQAEQIRKSLQMIAETNHNIPGIGNFWVRRDLQAGGAGITDREIRLRKQATRSLKTTYSEAGMLEVEKQLRVSEQRIKSGLR